MFFEYGLTGLLMRTAVMKPKAPAVAYGTRVVYDYAGLMSRVEAISGWFQRQGVQRGDRVVLFLKNHPAWLEIMFGCWHAGLVVVPVNVKLHAQELLYILQDSTPSYLFHDAGHEDAELALAQAAEINGIAIDTGSYERMFDGPRGKPVAWDMSALGWLFYTSGTTGRPKGAMLTHANLLAMAQAYATDVEPDGVGRAILHAAPMSHGSGLYMLAHVLHGSLQICPESRGFDVAEIEALLDHYTGVSFFVAPTMATRLIANAQGDLPGLHTMICGGAPMYVADTVATLKRFGPRIAQIYGQGESPMTITALPKYLHDLSLPDVETLLASCGFPQTGIQVRVVDSLGSTLPPGEPGEIIVRGATVMSGYWNLPEATANTLKSGWLYTGDIGIMSAQGALTLKDRSKEVIISGGSNIYPREVEEVLLQHEAVREVAVIGMNHHDWGEIVVACVVADVVGLSLEGELDQLCTSNIARFKRPKRYVFLDALPKNATGKIMKKELRAMLASDRNR